VNRSAAAPSFVLSSEKAYVTATVLRTGLSRVRIPVGQQVYLFFRPCSLRLKSTSQVLIGYLNSFLEVRRPGSEADHLPSPCVDVKHEWSHTSNLPILLYGVNREIFIFT
jgi:hypothetical protein